MSCVYLITMPDGKQYVGLTTKTPQQRLAKHIEDAKRGRATSICDALRKARFKGAIIQCLFESDDIEMVYESEKEFIRIFNTRIPNGHNATIGGRGIRGCIRKNILGEYVDTTKSKN